MKNRDWQRGWGAFVLLLWSGLFAFPIISTWVKSGPPDAVATTVLLILYEVSSAMVFWLVARPRRQA